ncbi:hypothetical protein EW146_g6252 [Bondarzewia mesenterica]|uniref:Uncharacterized protein n=1 Tax=Bondarzewia mesenterica TaxID=1095465 RepID=A0A4S4LR82_9AGAM|nr:hypothetical protein EW146_g6252 [Bondarzewia mesenterica]
MSQPAVAQKTVLITGCSEGGLRVFATARNTSTLEASQGLHIETLQLDVTDTNSILSAKSRVAELTGGKLDILVNNAGISYPYAAADVSLDEVKSLFNVNLFAVMEMVQQFLPLLLASADARIVQLGSLAGVMPVPFGAAYNASKAALHYYGDTLRVELAPFNVKVITFVLGNVRSNLSKPWHVLPANSIYQPIKQEYQSRRIDNFQKSAVPREPIARSIVEETLKSSPRAWVWGGANAWTVWFISTFLSRRGFDGILSKIFGLSKLASLATSTETYRFKQLLQKRRRGTKDISPLAAIIQQPRGVSRELQRLHTFLFYGQYGPARSDEEDHDGDVPSTERSTSAYTSISCHVSESESDIRIIEPVQLYDLPPLQSPCQETGHSSTMGSVSPSIKIRHAIEHAGFSTSTLHDVGMFHTAAKSLHCSKIRSGFTEG